MQKVAFTFELGNNESVEMKLIETDCIEEIFYNTFVHVFFKQREKRTLLTYDVLHEPCLMLSIFGKRVLEGNYYFNERKISDIGLTYNEAFYRSVSSDFVDIISEHVLESIDKYDLWPPIVSKNNMQTWVYNNAKGEIILFIAPVYPFNFCSKRVKGYLPYWKWIKGYKPFVKRIIPKETVQQWAQQAEEIMELIEINSKPYLE